jgi:hypothetical protein
MSPCKTLVFSLAILACWRSPAIIPVFADDGINLSDEVSGTLVREHADSYSKFISGGKLNQLVVQYAQKIDPAREPNPALAKLWSFMVDNGLIDDIQKTKYIASGLQCSLGSDPGTAASTVIAGPKSPTQSFPNHADVCWDLNKIINERTELPMILALALHEEAHHFGFDEPGAYAITQMVGSQLLSMQIPTIASVTGQSPREVKDSLPMTSLKRGTKLRILQQIPSGFSSMYNGTVHETLPVDMVGVYCWTNGSFQIGGTYKLTTQPSAGFSGNDAPGVLSEVSMFLDGPGFNSAVIDCEENPEGNRVLTVEDFIQAVDGIIEIEN